MGNSDAALSIDNFSNGDFPIGADSAFDPAATPVDRFVSSASTTALPVPPPRVFGTFDVTAPSAEGDYTLTSNFSGGSELTNTIVTDAAGTALTVTDFGDVIIRVAAAPLPTVTLDAATQTVSEDAGTVNVTVNLSAASATDVTVPFTVSGTATDGSDFSITASPITITAGQTSASAVVTVTDDTEVESSETVIVTLGTPTGASLGATGAQTVTITDNDVAALPTASIGGADQTVGEADGAVTITVNLSAASASDVSIPFTVSGTATDGSDFSITTSPITITAGQTSADVTVTVTDDMDVESTETVIVTLGTPTGATLAGTTSQTISITDNDMAAATPTVSISGADQTVSEDAGTVNVTVTLSAASASDVSIPFTVSGTATDGSDFTATTSPVTIAAGATSATVAVNVIDDTVVESAETVVVTLGTPTGATLAGTTAQTITINDNDVVTPVTPTVNFTAATQSGIESIGTLTINATLSAAATSAVTVPFTVSGTAADSDFSISASPITFAAGETSASVTINVVDDTIDEGNETVIVTLGTPNGADLGSTSVHTATIIDNDGISVDGNRIIIPQFVARPHVIPGDSQPTAILMKAEANTVLTVGQVGTTSLTETITILNESLASIGSRNANGVYSANLTEGSLYAVIIQGRDTQGIYSIRSSEGFETLSGSTTNILLPTDVNADGQATSLDALMVINRLAQEVLAEGEEIDAAGRYYDVNGDGTVSASDALRIINQVGQASIESEQVAAVVAAGASADDDSTVESGSIDASNAGSVASFDVAELLAQSIAVVDLDTAAESGTNIDEVLNDGDFLDGLLF